MLPGLVKTPSFDATNGAGDVPTYHKNTIYLFYERNVRLTTVDILNRVGLISGLQKQIFYHHSYNFGHKDKVCVLCVAGPIKDKRCSSIILRFQHLTMCLLVFVVQRAARTR